MNTASPTATATLPLVDIVHLKWMLAGEGLHVHVEKLQSDPDYACACLQAAERSASATLRQLATKMRERMGLGLDTAT